MLQEKDIQFDEITDENLEQACRAHQMLEDMYLGMKAEIEVLISLRKIKYNEITAYKHVRLINDVLLDRIIEFVHKKGYQLVPITN